MDGGGLISAVLLITAASTNHKAQNRREIKAFHHTASDKISRSIEP